MGVTIRILDPVDADVYAALRREMLKESPQSFGSSPETDAVSTPEGMRARIEGQGVNRTFGAFEDSTGALVGVVGGGLDGPSKKRAHVFCVWGMYVTNASRGSGVARKLMRALLDYAATVQHVNWIDLSVSETASAAHALYKSLGFVEWGREQRALFVDGEFITEIHMSLDLS